MDAVDIVGARVSAGRRRAGLTLAALAQRSGLSTAYLSQIESALANPTVRTLQQIAVALDADVVTLFGTEPSDRAPGPAFASCVSPVPRAVTGGGPAGIWDRTAPGSTRLCARLVYGAAGDHATPTTHPGEEIVVVVHGTCRLHVDGLPHDLTSGDACHFDASRPHHLSDVSSDLVLSVTLSVAAPDRGADRGRR